MSPIARSCGNHSIIHVIGLQTAQVGNHFRLDEYRIILTKMLVHLIIHHENRRLRCQIEMSGSVCLGHERNNFTRFQEGIVPAISPEQSIFSGHPQDILIGTPCRSRHGIGHVINPITQRLPLRGENIIVLNFLRSRESLANVFIHD